MHALPRGSALHHELAGDRVDWTHLAANVAGLFDLMSFWLHSEYARWTTDPDDPDYRRAVRERRRAGIKPPPFPIPPPVAHRPPSVATEYRQAYDELTELYGRAPAGREVASRAESRLVSSDEFDRIFGLM